MIFTALFFSVTFNSPANYSSFLRFGKFLAFSRDTTPIRPPSLDTIPRRPFRKDSINIARKDSANIGRDTVPRDAAAEDSAILAAISRDSIERRKDSIRKITDTMGITISKDTLAAPIDYSATDSMVMNVHEKTITLYNGAKTKYQDANLEAYKIQMDQERNVVIASHTRDTAGNVVGLPKIVQSDNTMQSDTIVYDIKTQKAITRDTYTQSGDLFVHADRMKKVSKEEYFALRGRFTTCNLDTPHFAFISNKMKLINQKMAISGPIHPEFEGVPVPIYLPFGFFPISTGRHSGLLPPQFTASPQYGVGLEGLGYYKVLNDYFDVTMRTNIYSYGGYSIFFTPTYRKRYAYSGQLNFTWQNTRTLTDAGKDAYVTGKTYSLNWSHTVDSKARPGTNFSANVNIASTKFNQYVLNNPTLNYQNQLSSSITYSKTWDGKYNLSVSANHNQNNLTRLVNFSFPNLSFSAPTVYPFQKKEFVGEQKWYEKLGVGLSTSISGGESFYDSLFNFKHLLDTFQWGANNSIPISVTLPLKGPIQVSPGISLSNRVYSRKLFRQYDPATNKVDTVRIVKGIYTAEDMAFSLSLSSAIFGTFQNFGKNSTLRGIRHVIRPTLSISYKPDLSGSYYYNLTTPWGATDSATKTTHTQRVSYFDGSTYGPFGEGVFGGVSFGLDNHFEIKVHSKKDTTDGGIKKLPIIDGVGFQGSYNYLADSFKLSPISFYLRSTLFEKINITGSASLDPYISDTAGFDRNIYAWQQGKGFSLGRITSGNVAVSTSFKSKAKDAKKEQERLKQQQDQIPMTVEEQQAQLNYIRSNPAEFTDFNIPWTLNLSFALNFTNTRRPDFSGFQTNVTSSFNWSGDFNLTEKWKVGMQGYYDLHLQQIQSLSLAITRDMHCWQMSINVTPVGLNHFFNFTINPKAGILQDLKINRTRYFYNQ
ncbi:MAG: putative LPS assembly protein LptD [Bacteroidota bacterium]|nr:putative LPS assembly protein LptD [Bacteroidota bacterium]MDP4252838.1 putative LPS assembly protein LptD [Bacteroidota bacterium]MDP4260560.1 putative LPS assembly protein LptD [Bacteroidota bacterium]